MSQSIKNNTPSNLRCQNDESLLSTANDYILKKRYDLGKGACDFDIKNFLLRDLLFSLTYCEYEEKIISNYIEEGVTTYSDTKSINVFKKLITPIDDFSNEFTSEFE